MIPQQIPYFVFPNMYLPRNNGFMFTVMPAQFNQNSGFAEDEKISKEKENK